MLTWERSCWENGCDRVAGVDEAGRGPLAGPVVAAAVAMPRALAESLITTTLSGLTDSKKLTEKKREAFFTDLTVGYIVLTRST